MPGQTMFHCVKIIIITEYSSTISVTLRYVSPIYVIAIFGFKDLRKSILNTACHIPKLQIS